MNAPELVLLQSETRLVSRGQTGMTPTAKHFDLDWAAQVGASVLFTGSGDAIGLGRRIHALSGWRWGPFVVVDCGWPDAMLEQRLFDLLRADPDPEARREPQLRLLQAGTIFLHEVGALGGHHQARLAEALTLASGSGERRGSRYRFMASTSQSLLQRVSAGTFDDRLFYRLNMLHVVLPREPRA